MGSNALIFAWNRTVPGRERLSGAHFQEFLQYLGGLQQNGAIASFEVVFLDPHGGDLNGFFLLRADTAQLDALLATDEWTAHVIRAAINLDGAGVVRGVTGDAVMQRMALWASNVPA